MLRLEGRVAWFPKAFDLSSEEMEVRTHHLLSSKIITEAGRGDGRLLQQSPSRSTPRRRRGTSFWKGDSNSHLHKRVTVLMFVRFLGLCTEISTATATLRTRAGVPEQL